MNQVSSSFIISQIIDGDTVMGGLMSTKALAQFYNEGDAQVIPNWGVPANQPVIYPYIFLGSDATPLVPTGVTWYYMDKNSKAIITDASPFDITEFEIQSGITVPALKLIGNLANNTSNMERDTIFFKGTVYPQGVNGAPMEINLQIDINISQATGSGIYANIICKNNNVEVPPVLSESISELVLTAKAYSASDVEQSTLSRKWYKNGTEISDQTGESITVKRDSVNAWQQVDTYAVYRCDFLDNGSVVASAFIEVQDATDPYMIKIDWTDNRTQLAKGETASGQCAVVKRSSPSSTVTGYSFSAILTKANGATITQDATCQVTSAGAITVTYAALAANGGSVAGYITAQKS